MSCIVLCCVVWSWKYYSSSPVLLWGILLSLIERLCTSDALNSSQSLELPSFPNLGEQWGFTGSLSVSTQPSQIIHAKQNTLNLWTACKFELGVIWVWFESCLFFLHRWLAGDALCKCLKFLLQDVFPKSSKLGHLWWWASLPVTSETGWQSE